MASRSSHNKNNAGNSIHFVWILGLRLWVGVKRILQEARELATDPSNDYHAAPLEDDIFVCITFLYVLYAAKLCL